ncbi:MAG: HEAT repeat domain-containing protein, partial [Desulfatiglandales bacterium]
GELNDVRAVVPLIATLKDENKYLRQTGARALGKLKDRRAIEPLNEALKDEDHDVRRTVAWAMLELNDSSTDEPIMAVLKDDIRSFVKKAERRAFRRMETGKDIKRRKRRAR